MKMSLDTRVFFLLALIAVPVSAGWRAEGPALASVNDLAISSGTAYVATHSGGVWRSDDAGATWHLPGAGMTRRNVVWIAVHPGDEDKLWAGVNARSGKSGLWWSKDRGATWERVPITALDQPIAFAPSEPQTVFVPATNRHFRSQDGGKTWVDFRVPNQDAYAFAVHPTDSKIVLAGGRGESLNISRSADGGQTWRQMGIGLGQNSVEKLIIDPAEPSTVFAVAGTFGVVYKSMDQGENWTELKLPIGGTSKIYSLHLDPRGKGLLWAATEEGLLRSRDGGTSWLESDSGMGSFLCKTVAFDLNDPARMLAGSSGRALYMSRDDGSTWSLSNKGIGAGWTEKLWASRTSDLVFAQMSGGLYRRDATGSWTEIREPFSKGKAAEVDGFIFDRSSSLVYAHDTSKYWKSSDGGKKWKEVEQEGPSMRDMMKGNLDSAQFASLVQDPGQEKVFYAGSWSSSSPGSTVFKTKDGGEKWKPAGVGLPGGRVHMLRSESPSIVFAVVAKEGLFRTTDAAGSWKSVGKGLPVDDIHELAIDPTDPTRLFAATDEGLFQSQDGGDSWARVEGGPKGDVVRAVAIDPDGGKLYAGSFEGVFHSADGGATWTNWSDDLPNIHVRALAVGGTPARLWAGTGGGSVYSTELTR